jgi:Phosphoenolpyruvate phosphomutase
MCMITQADKAERFLTLHRPGEPLLMPNPWDLGSARLFASLGFEALATTSSGFAATLGRNDGSVSREEALVHAAVIVAATDLAGASVEDFTGRDDHAIYDLQLAAERIAAASETAHAGSRPWPNWPRPGSAGSPWAARSHSPPSRHSSGRPTNCASREPTVSGRPARPVPPRPAVPSAEFRPNGPWCVPPAGAAPHGYTCGATSEAISARWSRSLRSSTCR